MAQQSTAKDEPAPPLQVSGPRSSTGGFGKTIALHHELTDLAVHLLNLSLAALPTRL